MPFNPITELKDLVDNYAELKESNIAIKRFENGEDEHIQFASKNQAKVKKKMAIIKGMKNVSDFVIPVLAVYMASELLLEQYNWYQDMVQSKPEMAIFNEEGLNKEALMQHKKDAEFLWDYATTRSLAASAVLLSITSNAFVAASSVKNPSEIRFHKKEKEQNKILKEFFNDTFMENMINEDNMLMLGYGVADGIKKFKGADNKMIPAILMKSASIFLPQNHLEVYNKEQGSENKFNSVHAFTSSFFKTDKNGNFIPEIDSYMKDIIENEKNDKNKFDRRDQMKYIGEKLEKAYERVYRERELEKTALIGVKMLSKAKSNPEGFKSLYEKNKGYFNKTLNDELPYEDKEKYKEILTLMERTDRYITQGKIDNLDNLDNIAKDLMIKHNLGKKENVLDRVKQTFIDIVEEDSYQMQYKITNKAKDNNKLKQDLHNKKQKKLSQKRLEIEASNLIRLVSSSHFNNENDAKEIDNLTNIADIKNDSNSIKAKNRNKNK